MGVAESLWGDAGDRRLGPAVGQPGQLRIEQGNLDSLAFGATAYGIERGQDAVGGKHAGGQVGDRDADLHRRAVLSPRDTHDPAFCLDREVKARQCGLGAVVRVAADGAVDEVWIIGS